MNAKIKEVIERFRCPVCEEDYDDEFDAETCCNEEWQCEECEEWWIHKEEAERCCRVPEPDVANDDPHDPNQITIAEWYNEKSGDTI